MQELLQLETIVNIFFQQTFAFLNPVMQFFSFLGDEYFFLLVIPFFFWCVDYRAGLRLGVMLMLANSSNMIFKLIFRTPRPYWINTDVQALRTETSFGLPSGHSQVSASLWGLFGFSQPKIWLRILCIFVILMVGISRIQLGVHYLHDVLLGWLLGVLLLILFIKFEKPVAESFLKLNPAGRLNFSLIISLAMIFFPLLLVLISKNWSLPQLWQNNALGADPSTSITPMSVEGAFTIAGTTLGTLLGLSLFLEKYRGIPNMNGSLLTKTGRFLVGMAGLAIIYFGLKLISPEGETLIALIMRFIRYGLLGVWISGAAPYIFLRLKWIDIEKVNGLE